MDGITYDNFVYTSNRVTADELRRMGLHEVSSDGEHFFFLNCKNVNFSGLDDVTFTNRIFV